jgi:hypothetical protein
MSTAVIYIKYKLELNPVAQEATAYTRRASVTGAAGTSTVGEQLAKNDSRTTRKLTAPPVVLSEFSMKSDVWDTNTIWP